MAEHFLSVLGNNLLQLIFPQLCEGCRKSLVRGEKILCLSCENYLPTTHYHHLPENETALRISGRFAFEQATSYGYFTKDGLLQHLLHRLKYSGKKEIGIFLGNKFGQELKNAGWNVEAIIPVPLHAKKKAKRGFNQSELIAEGLGEVLNIPVISNFITRTKNTTTQTDKSREERIANVQDAFRVNDQCRMPYKRLMLLDDVLTTGATLEACAKTILNAGDYRISIATIALA